MKYRFSRLLRNVAALLFSFVVPSVEPALRAADAVSDVSLARTGSLSGSVSNVRTGKFLEGAMVRISSLDRQTYTNDRGLFAFTNLPPGTYEVEVSYLGLNSTSRSVVVATGGPSMIAF